MNTTLFTLPIRYLLLMVLLFCGNLHAKDPDSLLFVFQKQKDPSSLKSEAEQVSKFLTNELGMKVTAKIPSDYAASVQALVSKNADIAYVDSIAYLLAKRDGDASLLLAEERPDASGNLRTDYDSIFVVRKDSPIKSFDDIVKNAKDLRLVFTSPTSTSGYVMAYRRLVNDGVLKAKQDPKEVFKNVAFGGSYTQALEQVAMGRGDVCAVSYYTMEGPKAGEYLPKETRDQLRVVARTPGVPTHVITARGGLSEGLKTKIASALKKLSTEKPELLADVYGASALTSVEEQKHVQATVQAMDYLGLPIEGFVNKKKS